MAARTPRATSVRSALEVLVALSADEGDNHEGLTVTEIAALTGRDQSQVSRFLQALMDFALVERDRHSRRFRLGPRIYVMANRLNERDIYRRAPTVLAELVASTGESAHLSVLAGSRVLTIASQLPARQLQTFGRAGMTFPLPSTSAGRALLFDQSRRDLELVLTSADFETSLPKAPKTVEEVWERLERERAQGYTVSDEETEPGLFGLGAPVRDFERRIVAAVNISGPRFRLAPQLRACSAKVMQIAVDLSAPVGAGAAAPDSRQAKS